MQQVNLFFSIILFTCLLFASCNNEASNAQKGNEYNAFGDSIPISNGLMGKIFLLPVNTVALPDFDTMKPLDKTIYVDKIDIPEQSWSLGFPGLQNRFEWFGIEYTCSFKTYDTGNYTFRIVSDDGSKLFIDNKLIINNDGLHSDVSKSGDVFLNDSMHEAKIMYFQGPRYQLALQLFWSKNNAKEQIFPGKNFILYTPKPASHFKWWWLLLAVILLIAIAFITTRKKRQKQTLLKAPGNNTNNVVTPVHKQQ